LRKDWFVKIMQSKLETVSNAEMLQDCQHAVVTHNLEKGVDGKGKRERKGKKREGRVGKGGMTERKWGGRAKVGREGVWEGRAGEGRCREGEECHVSHSLSLPNV